MKQIIERVFPKAVILLATVLGWKLASITTNNLIPNPYSTFVQILILLKTPSIYSDIIFTIINILISLGISLLVATIYVLLSLILPSYIKQFTSPFVSAFLFIPAIIIVYICIIIFGYNSASIRLVMILVVSPVLINSFSSLPGQINKDYFKISKIYGLSVFTTTKKIILPQIMTLVASAMNNSFSIATRIAILAEAIIGNKGIGYQIAYNFYLFDLERVLALSIISITIIYFFPRIIHKIYISISRLVIK